jgi:hypothetical protein
MSPERFVKDLFGPYTEKNGAPKGTILELFSENLCQVCHRRLTSPLD